MSITPKQIQEIIKETVRDELEPIHKKIDKNHNEVLGAFDEVAKKLDTIETELVSNQAAHDRFEKRLTRLEAHAGLKPLSA